MVRATPVEVVDEFIASAYVAQDYERLRNCLGDTGFTYEDPVNRFFSADDLVQFQMMVAPIIEKVEVLRRFADGNEVCAVLQVTARLNERTSTLAVLWATVHDGRIERMVGVYDAHEYKLLYEVEDG